MLPKKQLSGAQQRKKSKHDDKLAESQRGALHKFFSVEVVMLMSTKFKQRGATLRKISWTTLI